MSVHEHEPPEDFISQAEMDETERNLKTILRLMDLADLAALAFSMGDYQTSFEALRDYRSLRQEMAHNPLRI